MKEKNKKKSYQSHSLFYRYKIIIGIILALAMGIGIFSAVFTWREKAEKEKAMKAIIAPYYDEKEFKRPLFLPTPVATKEALPQLIKIPIVMYHYVEYVQDQGDFIRKRLDIVPGLFEKQLADLKKSGYDTYYVKDVPDILTGKIHYSTQSAILSFDDGYEDFYTDVFPLLKKYHMRATFFPIYDFIGRKGFVTKDQIQELVDSDLVEIGSHTLDHTYLKYVSDAVAKKQIFESKKRLEEDFHIKVSSFAYPYGAMSPQAIQYVKDAGYTAAVSVISGTLQSPENLFFLSRVRPGLFGNSFVRGIESMKK